MNNPMVYAQNNQNQKLDTERWFGHFGDILRRKFEDKAVSLLDIGTGCGSVLSEVVLSKSKLNFGKVVGVDKCPEMVKYCRQQFDSDLMSFEQMDAEGDIPDTLKNEKFDIITSFYCLHWVRDLNNAFRNFCELLKPDGIFCCVFLLENDIVNVWNRLGEKLPDVMKNWQETFTSLWNSQNPEKQIRQLLEGNGFKNIKIVDDRERGHDFKDIEGVTGHLVSVDPFLKYLSDEKKQKYLKDFQEVFNKLRKFDDFVVSRRVLHIIGQNEVLTDKASGNFDEHNTITSFRSH